MGEEILFGSLAGMAAKLLEHPFDLTKVRLQSQNPNSPPRFLGPWDCASTTYTREGIRGLYRGLSAPLVGAAAENAVLFFVYDQCQSLIQLSIGNPTFVDEVDGRVKARPLSIPQLALAASGAGAAASFVLTPIELVKCRMQVQMLAAEGYYTTAQSSPLAASTISTQPAKPPGPIALISGIIRTHGLRGMYLGQGATLVRETGGSSAWFTANEIMTRFFLHRRERQRGLPKNSLSRSKDLSTVEICASGAAAGVSYNLVLYPVDCVKSSIQTFETLRGSEGKVPSFWEMGKEIYVKRGIRGLYAGCGITLLRAAPSSALIFIVYENLKARFGSE